ncbi:hypothetical protein ACYEXS_34730 [Paenibacillus sp. MAH-36]|uniref:Uncharacterized protein n=1 Tax=Paenibacillus violae TaxID=3077234 RepID=A0ABU3RL15_9BACL|nr:hypothetical protein [Paenibacillus sp. PFR10]MDU0204813.1 hypothetical protein [Paenibacillus sp. PFR10]
MEIVVISGGSNPSSIAVQISEASTLLVQELILANDVATKLPEESFIQ